MEKTKKGILRIYSHHIILLVSIFLLISCGHNVKEQKTIIADTSQRQPVNWWWEPVFYARGELNLLGGAAASTQENYQRFMISLTRYRFDPGTIIIDDKWCDLYGDPRADQVKWPDMRGFIDKYQTRGQRVVLCMKLWDTEGVPVDECILQKGKPIAVDPYNSEYEKRLRGSVRRMLSSDTRCLNASGLFLANISEYRELKLGDNNSGVEYAKRLLSIIRDEAKKIKPDALLIADTVDPVLAKMVDMLYLNPIITPGKSLKENIDSRIKIATTACPGCFITWGIFPVSGKKEWNDNVSIQLLASEKEDDKMKRYNPGKIVPHPTVVPMLYYATRVGNGKEDVFTWNDYETLRKIRNNYRWKYQYSHPVSIRKIRAKTASWSALAPGQIIAQPSIQPIVSSGGYDTRGVKRAVVWLNNEDMSGTFELIDATRNVQDPTQQAVCYKGKLQPAGNKIWGGNNLVADFTDFQKPGFYLLRIHLDKTIETVDASHFMIEDNFYMQRASQAGHWYYYERCGTEIPGSHKACHLSDGILPDGTHKDFTGGWHDGGDYNKWSHYGYYGIISLLELAELEKEQHWKDTSPLPSPIDDADWECKFILKILTPEGHLMSLYAPGPSPWNWLGVPEGEPVRMARVENGRSPQVTAWTAAALARMAVYSNNKYVKKYKDAAERLYDIISSRSLDDPEYKVFKNDYLGIQSALLMTDISFIKLGFNMEKYQKDALNRVNVILGQQDKKGFFYTDKERTNKLILSGYFMLPLYHFLEIPAGHSWKEKITGSFVRWARFIEPTLGRTPFGQVGSFDFIDGKTYLGPNGNIGASLAGWGLATTALLTGDRHYLKEAQQQMSWILGCNPTALSMMADVGNNPRCFHHRYAAIPPGGRELLPGGILNGIVVAKEGKPSVLGDINTQNFVFGDNLPTNYPILDDDVFGWTWAYGTNEYWTPNNAYFILMASQIERAMKKVN